MCNKNKKKEVLPNSFLVRSMMSTTHIHTERERESNENLHCLHMESSFRQDARGVSPLIGLACAPNYLKSTDM